MTEDLPEWWTPSGVVDGEAWITLAVIGALWGGEIAGIPIAWDGESLRGDGPGLLTAMQQWRAARAGKGGVWLGGLAGPHHGILVDPRRVGADIWTGQIDATMIWRGSMRMLDPMAPLDQRCLDQVRPTGRGAAITTPATGYHWMTAASAIDAGFSISLQNYRMPRYPGAEPLMLLGVEWLIRHHVWGHRQDVGVLPAIEGRPIRATVDLQNDQRPTVPYRIVHSGRRKYLGDPDYSLAVRSQAEVRRAAKRRGAQRRAR